MKRATAGNIVLLSTDTVLCTSLTSLFEARGHRVTADVEVANRAGHQASCVVVDLDRPSTPLSCEWLESHFPRAPLVVLSGSPWSGPHAAACLSNGYFLPKPVAALDLTSMVEGVIHDQPVG
jgi:hypothetical protein